MRYIEPLFRPPSEADSLIFQVTIGCSHNACVFCAMYRTKDFRVRPLEEILGEIVEVRESESDTRRVFLADGDALAAPTDFLVKILRKLRESFPRLRRISLYATPQNLLQKSSADLELLKESGLTLFYLGLESGSDSVLKRQAKGVTARQAVEAVRKGQEAGLKSSLMILLGLGGVEGSEEHAKATAEVLNGIQPNYLSALTWYPVREAPLMRLIDRGDFTLLTDGQVLDELETLLEGLELRDTVFRANHASNPLPLGGRLNRDKKTLLELVESARRGSVPLRPFFFRGT